MAKLSKNINNEEEDGKKELPTPDPSKHTRLGKVVGEDRKEEAPKVKDTKQTPALLQQEEHKSFTEKAENTSIQLNVEAVAEWLMRIFGQTTIERWIGAAFLWHTIVNLSGILESQNWLMVSELMRLVFISIGFILFNDWHTQPIYVLIISSIAVLSTIWTILYFKPIKKTGADDEQEIQLAIR